MLFASRYLKKCPLSNKRLKIIDGNPATIIEYTSYKNEQKSIRTFEPLKFMAEIQQHNLSRRSLGEGGFQIPESRPPDFLETTHHGVFDLLVHPIRKGYFEKEF